MTKAGFLAALLLVTTAVPGSATADENVVGLYFDEAATTVCAQAAPDEWVDCYLVVTNPTFGGLSAVFMAFVIDGPVFVLSSQYYGPPTPQICDVWPPDFCHEWDPPYPVEGSALVIARFTFWYGGQGEPATAAVRRIWPDSPGPIDVGDENGDVVYLYPSTGYGQPMIQFNGDCAIVPAAGESWGGVKSLYR